ncbi:MAG: glycerol-3-phosphate dehydrogenase [Edaphobacter sp.]|jgi:hypothetical protein|nr:glycerol-3-phosphate dehydrogenase [Edaphobacter sp.]
MAFPTAVNDQITDSVSQANLKVLGDAPAMGLGSLFVATSQALSNAAHNATFAQQQAVTTSQTVNVQGLSTLYSIDTASTGVSTGMILGLGTYSKGQ